LTPGWATFGQVLPVGVARDALKVGDLPTQTDVKTRWRDGSIRFAVVTARAPRAGTYRLHAVAAEAGRFDVKAPVAEVRLVVGEQAYTAALPAQPTRDVWLSGPLVHEWRAVVAPAGPGGKPHPFLRVLFDTRCHAGGGCSLDVTVENLLDVAHAKEVTYDVEVRADGKSLFRRKAVTHYYLTRWRKKFPLGLSGSQVTLDFRPFTEAHALPRYMSSVTKDVNPSTGPKFDILNCGDLAPGMSMVGGRPEIAPYPDWAARYLVHHDPTQKRYVLANGDLAGSWPVHIRNPDGSLISIDQRPNYWLDPRWFPWGDGPGGLDKPKVNRLDGVNTGPLKPDMAHQPSLAYIPYLVTGDRYYADEMKFWGNYELIGTWPGNNNEKQGSKGLLAPWPVMGQVRAVAWGLRNMTDAAAYLPDQDPDRKYLGEKVLNNLAWMERLAETHRTPLDTVLEGGSGYNPKHVVVSVWQQSFLAWAIDHANEQGLQGGLKLRDRMVRFRLKLFTDKEFPRKYCGIDWPVVGLKDASGKIRYFTSWADLCKENLPPGARVIPLPGYYGADARLALMIAVRNGWPGARDAYDYVFKQIAIPPSPQGVSDLASRAGWAIAFGGEK
jgi:hypothetical protein